MSVPKKSLISSQPTAKKTTAEPAKETAVIGEPKALTASALRPAFYQHKRNATAAHAFKAMKKKGK
jgi:hypothetical protein